MNKRLSSLYAGFCLFLFLFGSVTVFLCAWNAGSNSSAETGIWTVVECLIGLFIGIILSPVIHELGHVSFALANKMDYVYVKCFCFKIYLKNGKKRFALTSPFLPDETQVVPKTSGNMQKRAIAYTLGGLVFGGVFLFVILTAAIVCTALKVTNFTLWGMLPYAAYLFLLNILPAEYPLGKTDMAVCLGVKRGEDVERNMLSAMEIHGNLNEGKSFSEIDEKLYFDLPQLRMDEPLYTVILDLRYRYYLEKEDLEKAADCLNRLVNASAYLPESELEKISAELVYMHSQNGDFERAEESCKFCESYLKSQTLTAKRVLAAYSKARGKEDSVAPLLEQARTLLSTERMLGVRKFEEILLSRIEKV